MKPMLKEYLNRYLDLHREIEQALQGLPQEALDWVPGPDMNSLNVLVTHLTGAERYWIGDVAMGDISHRDREAEFRIQGLSAEDLIERLRTMDSYCQTALNALEPSDLEAVRASPRDGGRFTVTWSLLHALEHTAIHLGHIQMVSQMWKQRQMSGKG